MENREGVHQERADDHQKTFVRDLADRFRVIVSNYGPSGQRRVLVDGAAQTKISQRSDLRIRLVTPT